MKSIKRIALSLLLIIIVAIVFVFVYMQVRRYESKSQLVHRESAALLKIALDDIMYDILYDKLLDMSFFGSDTSSSTNKLKDLQVGIDLPANLYFFSMDESSSSIYSYQELKDEKVFINTILKTFKADSTDIHREGNIWSFQNENGKFKLIGDAKNVLISLSYATVDNNSKLRQLWNGRFKNMQEVRSIHLLDNVKLNNNIDYVSFKHLDRFCINFHKGKVVGQVKLLSVQLQHRNTEVRKMDEAQILSAYCNVDPKQLLEFFKSSYISPSIKTFLAEDFSGYADIQWKKGTVIQQDSIITYEYDDNFEATEVKALHDVEVPDLTVTFKEYEHELLKDMFFKFHKTNQGEYAEWRTSEAQAPPMEMVKSKNFLEIKYIQDTTILHLLDRIPKLKLLKSCNVIGSSENPKHATISVNLNLTNEKKHPLEVLFL